MQKQSPSVLQSFQRTSDGLRREFESLTDSRRSSLTEIFIAISIVSVVLTLSIGMLAFHSVGAWRRRLAYTCIVVLVIFAMMQFLVYKARDYVFEVFSKGMESILTASSSMNVLISKMEQRDIVDQSKISYAEGKAKGEEAAIGRPVY